MKKYKTYLKYFIYSVIFIFVIIISYRSARPRYKPEHYTDIFKDFSWLGDWPKWLDFPLMQPLNSGFDWLIVNYGMFFEGINNFLLGLYTSMKNSIVDLPWPLVIAIVILITYFASGRKTQTTVLVAFCTFFLGFLCFLCCSNLQEGLMYELEIICNLHPTTTKLSLVLNQRILIRFPLCRGW